MGFEDTFRANLAYWLESEGRKQSWLAKKLGVHPTAITGWLNGRTMPSKPIYFDQLADLMGLPSVACLFLENGVKDPENAYKQFVKDLNPKG